MKGLRVILSVLLMLTGAVCLAVSANGPWGFTMFGRFCWVLPLSWIVGGTGMAGLILWVVINRSKRSGRQSKPCPKCRAQQLSEWTLCHRCGEILKKDHHKKTTKV